MRVTLKSLTVLWLGVSACVSVSAKVPPPAPARPAVERQEIRAQLMPRRFTTLAAELPAKVSNVHVPEGGAFRAGQVLVSFDCTLPQGQLKKAQAELDGAEQTLQSNKRLLQLNAVGQLDMELSASAVNKANAEVSTQKAMLSKCHVIAPYGGRVAEQKVREQQFVQAGQPLMDILDDSVLELEFLVPSAWLGWLRAGGSLKVDIDETRKTYPAKYIRIGARVDPVSQSIKVAAAIDGRFPELIAGMSGRVSANPPQR
ncbi:efflux RND transporter periplasmic adaptor subunit [Rhodoferax mekongensis]|uniref:efflux RND transporter periplasmic adaptor subunit n=1 Tax=Rhodoferax mekongensis TaxID=3068341 RepID=UPI0028BD4151|nr:efflux RND transporter periplasmic adaptor subunit [Rhodoferax sp. TBRC 17199]MDT7515453.1 efflux RND transporter periplasmic adaptor subunit [Rhodoferax sp. TBRC 17199]